MNDIQLNTPYSHHSATKLLLDNSIYNSITCNFLDNVLGAKYLPIILAANESGRSEDSTEYRGYRDTFSTHDVIESNGYIFLNCITMEHDNKVIMFYNSAIKK